MLTFFATFLVATQVALVALVLGGVMGALVFALQVWDTRSDGPARDIREPGEPVAASVTEAPVPELSKYY